MTTLELEQLLLTLSPAEKRRMIQLLTQSLLTETTPTTQQTKFSLVEFFRNSPLCEVADELDLDRDKSPILDRINL